MAKNNCYEFGLPLSECEAFLARNEKEKMGAFCRNFIEYGGLGYPGYEPLHCFKDGSYRIHERFGQ